MVVFIGFINIKRIAMVKYYLFLFVLCSGLYAAAPKNSDEFCAQKLYELYEISKKLSEVENHIKEVSLQGTQYADILSKKNEDALENKAFSEAEEKMIKAYAKERAVEGLMTEDFFVKEDNKYCSQAIRGAVVRTGLVQAYQFYLLKCYERCLQEFVDERAKNIK
jgi:hypothetical protein